MNTNQKMKDGADSISPSRQSNRKLFINRGGGDGEGQLAGQLPKTRKKSSIQICCGRLIPHELSAQPAMLQPKFGERAYEFTLLIPTENKLTRPSLSNWNPRLADTTDLEGLHRLFERDFGGYTGPLLIEGSGERQLHNAVTRSYQYHSLYKVVARCHQGAKIYFNCLKSHLQKTLDQQVVFMSYAEVRLL
jgi:hypothetical protein